MNTGVARACWLILFGGVAGVVIALCANHEAIRYLINSDAVYLPLFLEDMLDHGADYADWRTPPAPYLFPDAALFALDRVFGADHFDDILIFGVLQVVGTAIALWAALRRFEQPASVAVAALALTIFLAHAVWVKMPFIYAFVSAHHFALIPVSLVILAIWPKAAPVSWIRLGAIALISFATMASDAFFVVQVAMPLLALAHIWKRRHDWHASIAACGGAALGYVAYLIWLTDAGRGLGFSILNIPQVFYLMLRKAWEAPSFALFLLAYLIAVYWCIKHLRGQDKMTPSEQGFQWLAMFSLAGFVINMVALVPMGISAHERYLAPSALWPIILTLSGAAVFWPRWATPIYLTTALLALTVIGWQAQSVVSRNGASLEYYPQDIACVDTALAETTARSGIAAYWQTKRFRAFNRLGLNVAHYTNDLTSSWWIDNVRNYRATYDFAIIHNGNPQSYNSYADAVTQLNGAPQMTQECGTVTLLVYEPGGLRVNE